MVSCALFFSKQREDSNLHITNFRSWVVMFYLCQQPIGFSYHSWYSMPWLAPLLNDLIWGWHEFHIYKFFGQGYVGNIWNRLLGSSIVEMGSHQTIWSRPLLNIAQHSGTWPYTLAPSIDQTCHKIVTKLDLITAFDLIYKFQEVSTAMDVACQQRRLTHPDTWSCPFWDLHLFKWVDHSLLNLSCFRNLNEHPSVALT